MDFRDIAEASVAFGESTKYAWNVIISTLETMQHLATPPRLVAEISPLDVEKLDVRAGYLNERTATGLRRSGRKF